MISYAGLTPKIEKKMFAKKITPGKKNPSNILRKQLWYMFDPLKKKTPTISLEVYWPSSWGMGGLLCASAVRSVLMRGIPGYARPMEPL